MLDVEHESCQLALPGDYGPGLGAAALGRFITKGFQMRTRRNITGKTSRRTAATVAALLTATAGVLVNGSPAYATDTSFNIAHVHAGGAGATGAATKGQIRWLNRSVALDNVQIYCGSNHFVKARFIAFQTNTQIGDPLEFTFDCRGFGAGWTSVGDHVLDASEVPGGINRVFAQAVDSTHGGTAEQRRNR